MTNIENCLGVSRLTADYRGSFFDINKMKIFKRKFIKILKSSDEEIIFITREKHKKRVFVIRVLKRFDDIPRVVEWTNEYFPTLVDAVAFYEEAAK
jgi:hypothetical protein